MRHTFAITAAILLALSGCGGDSGSSGGGLGGTAALPTGGGPGSQAFQVPRATAASNAVDLATEAVANTILDTHTQGEATGGPRTYLTWGEFEFTYQVDREIDLDATRPNGDDRFPNVSGTVLITVEGLLSGTWLVGEASYAVMIEAGTDIISIDPESGVEALIPAGSSWTCSLGVTWEITDPQNWIVVGTSTKAISLDGLVVTDGDVETTVSVNGGREVTRAIARIEGEIVREDSIEGSFTITIDDGVDVATVIIEFDADGLIVVTIGDEVFGPFTREEFIEFFNAEFA
jgi:hypothetical protein